MNLFEKYLSLVEGGDTTYYTSGTPYTARVYKNKNGMHVAKFFKDGKHMSGADYEHKSSDEVHEFAEEEMMHRIKEHNKVNERILEPQGHLVSPDRIADASNKGNGVKKKMMGNRTPLEIISRILAGR